MAAEVSQQHPRRDAIALALVALAFLLRVVYIFEQRANPFFELPLLDSLYHFEWAQSLAAGEPYQEGPFFRAPLYPWLLGSEMRILGFGFLGMRLFQAGLGALTTWLTYLLGRRAFGRGAGRLAALLVACNWVLVYFDGELLIPTLAIPLNLLALYLTLGLGQRPAPRALVLAGMAWGLAALARPNVLLLLPCLFFWLVWGEPHKRLLGVRRGLLLALGVLLPILPITSYNLLVGGDRVLISSQAGVNLWIGNNPASDGSTAIVPGTRPGWWDGFHDAIALAEAAEGRSLAPSEVSAHYGRKTLDFWFEEPRAALELFVWKLRLFSSRYELGNNQDVRFFSRRYSRVMDWLPPSWLLLLPLGGVGLMLALRRRQELFPLWGFVPVYGASVVLFFVCSRFRAPLLPVLAILGAEALVQGWRALKARRFGNFGLGLGLAVLLGLLVAPIPERIDRTDAKGLWQLGMYELEQGQANEALPWLYQSVEANPRFWIARRDLGLALRDTAQARAAQDQWSAALALQPGDLQISALFVELSVALDEVPRALAVARECVRLHPDLALPQATLGQALLAAGDPDGARTALRVGLASSPDDYLCNLRLGLLEREMKNPCAAVEPLARARSSPSAPSEEARAEVHTLWREARQACR